MNESVVITCAVTGSGDTLAKHPDLPVTPEQIADAVRTAEQPARGGKVLLRISNGQRKN